jgi:hypothetical protein
MTFRKKHNQKTYVDACANPRLIVDNQEACARLVADINDPSRTALGAAACITVEVEKAPPTYGWMTLPEDELTLRAAEQFLEHRRSREHERSAA